MIYCLYTAVSLCLIILQVTLIPLLPFSDKIYDLPVPYVLYLGLFRPAWKTLPIVILLGLVMDNLSGGPFGLFTSIYVWLFLGAIWMRTFMHASNMFLLPFVVACGVLLENLVFIGMVTIFELNFRFPEDALRIATIQVLSALGTSPIFLIFYNYTHNRCDSWMFKRSREADR